MRRPTPLPAALRGRPFLVAEALRLGVSARRLRAADLRAPHRQVRVESALEQTLALRCRCALLVLPTGSAFSGPTAAVLLGLPSPLAGPDPAGLPLHVAVPVGVVRPRVAGIRVRPHGLLPGEPVLARHGVPVLGPVRVWAEECGGLDLVDAVALGDAVRRRLDDVRDMVLAALALPDQPARDRALAVLDLVRYPVDSPMETRLRLLLRDAGLPEPVCGRAVSDGDHPVAWPDLSWPAVRVAVEDDGAHHLQRRQRQVDLGRQRVLDELGWQLLVVTDDDVLRRPVPTVALVERALRRRGLRW